MSGSEIEVRPVAAEVKPNFFCSKPFESVEVHLTGDAYVCCPSWLKKPIGNVKQDSLRDIWNSTAAQDIRSSILDGSYRYCDRFECPFLHTGSPARSDLSSAKINEIKQNKREILDYGPLDVMLTYDPSCNLSCPSCRTSKISFTQDSPEYKKSKDITENLHNSFVKNLKDGFLRLNITGSGDPFASLVFRQYLEELDGSLYPGLRIDLQTNGLLFNAHMWQRLKKIHKNIDKVFVSIDAATEETYVKVRRGGQWDVIVKNMAFLGSLQRRGEIKCLMARFVVQQDNYKEMPAFAKLFLSLGCQSIYFSRLTDWSTWSPDAFKKQLVFEPDHPEYKDFLNVLTHPVLQEHRVNLGNLLTLSKLASRKQRAEMGLLQRTLSDVRSWPNELVRRRFFLPRSVQNLIKRWTPFFK